MHEAANEQSQILRCERREASASHPVVSFADVSNEPGRPITNRLSMPVGVLASLDPE